jgi:electron transport complex protein RnfE
MNRINRKRAEKGKDVSKYKSGGCMNVDMEIPSKKDEKKEASKEESKEASKAEDNKEDKKEEDDK